MWIRSAFFEGNREQNGLAAFFDAIRDQVAPAIAALDGVRDVDLLWPQAIEDRPDEMLCQMLVRFEDEAGMLRMFASPGREIVRTRVSDLRKIVDFRVSHINYATNRWR